MTVWHMLVLDDDPGVGKRIRRVACGCGITVETPTAAAAFRSHFATQTPDAVVLDVQTEDEDGVEQLRFLSAAGYTGPILLLSGFGERRLQTARRVGEGLGLTVVATLLKPLRVEQLRAVLETLRPSGAWLPPPDALRQAIGEGELTLHLQPIVAARSGRPIMAEALARWTRPQRGPVLPARFVAVAEADPQLADALTLWAIEAAGRHQRELAARGLDLMIAVNVSAVNLRDLDFPNRVQAALRRAGAEPARMALELTETAAIQDPLRTADILLRLRTMGFELALDDFGTGYASLKVLKQMPFSGLKIDQSFVADLLTSPGSQAMVKAMVDIARNMTLQTVAEGVETEAIAAALEAMGVGALQGYHIGRPMPVEALIAWLAERPCLEERGPPP